ncbi:MAG: Lrp/AsnC family transcriptional regulator [Sterolibacteriaceae bacterium]|uniref:siroheme decarboxylase subunit beta n=1 Tax=Sulfuritalea sp. TaxID=2480090 RepID=UPI001A5AE292|nr:Lrp/AsnC family transcriptional regulator [Sulfuritalea sp.]MBL8478327.1 Lrp/AsnC family transcriptional regulator [Sterolibacteriaceae bacterium]MBN8475844.1 Lrp/AsnC family transcriptional regulator [Sulfuritalea sp.]
MDCPYTPLEYALLNNWQRDFPIVTHPFAEVGLKVGADETAILATLQRLRERGAISRVGAVFAPRRIGASTLAALAAPAQQIEEIAALVSARPEINHNYQREHRYNLWFVATAADQAALDAVLTAIELDTGCPVIALPLENEFHIDLGFDLASGHKSVAPVASVSARQPDNEEKRLIAALQPGLEIMPRPFRQLGETLYMEEDEVLARISGMIQEGMIKRFGVVVRHHELGYRSNAMVVFDLADDIVDGIGARLAAEPGVTLCYRRRRSLPDWPYNLYCMVHGRSRAEAQPVIDRLAFIAGAPATTLFSTRRFKQCGARYFSDSVANRRLVEPDNA